MSDLFGNHIVGFPTRWLKYSIVITTLTGPVVTAVYSSNRRHCCLEWYSAELPVVKNEVHYPHLSDIGLRTAVLFAFDQNTGMYPVERLQSTASFVQYLCPSFPISPLLLPKSLDFSF